MKENYIYPAIFSKGEEGETEIRFVDFPDILTYSETDDIDDVVRTAQDILALTIMDYEAEKKELPKPSSDIKGAAYIHIWMPYFILICITGKRYSSRRAGTMSLKM